MFSGTSERTWQSRSEGGCEKTYQTLASLCQGVKSISENQEATLHWGRHGYYYMGKFPANSSARSCGGTGPLDVARLRLPPSPATDPSDWGLMGARNTRRVTGSPPLICAAQSRPSTERGKRLLERDNRGRCTTPPFTFRGLHPLNLQGRTCRTRKKPLTNT